MGVTKQICVDFSDVVIGQMKARYKTRIDIQWLVMDVRALELHDEQMELAIDKVIPFFRRFHQALNYSLDYKQGYLM